MQHNIRFHGVGMVASILDKVEQLVDMQATNFLPENKTSLADVKQDSTRAKKKEIVYLTSTIEKTEEKNRHLRAEVESLKEERRDISTAAEAVEKLKSLNSSYWQIR
ncbi:hypothetical protein GIB67_040877 [Kingdonia uniflora]|uniref:Uncharacterized protein n=1 Tax=Kingdonia uniflora TaxID=39325 RepID=A0A7J7L7W4_9MAGN|nr:hypothetical protein GIB67_040877 [Kingdonia uniflora]